MDRLIPGEELIRREDENEYSIQPAPGQRFAGASIGFGDIAHTGAQLGALLLRSSKACSVGILDQALVKTPKTISIIVSIPPDGGSWREIPTRRPQPMWAASGNLRQH